MGARSSKPLRIYVLLNNAKRPPQVTIDEAPAGAEATFKLHYILCPPPDGTTSKGTILLIHGFPQTNYQFRKVITPTSDAGYVVLAPDYRGAGGSGKPWTGYDKATMATDLHKLVTSVLGIKEKIHVVGHDIGSMIAHAYATQFPNDTASVCWGEAPLPGSPQFQERKTSMGGWHYTFHGVPDLPELLVEGKEKIYLKHFYDRLSQNPDAISNDDLAVYAQAYALPGGLRCGFNCYRAFNEDGVQNNKWLEEKGPCPVRSLSLWGSESYIGEVGALEMAGRYYANVQYGSVARSGHWIAEENPKGFVESVLAWVAKE